MIGKYKFQMASQSSPEVISYTHDASEHRQMKQSKIRRQSISDGIIAVLVKVEDVSYRARKFRLSDKSDYAHSKLIISIELIARYVCAIARSER